MGPASIYLISPSATACHTVPTARNNSPRVLKRTCSSRCSQRPQVIPHANSRPTHRRQFVHAAWKHGETWLATVKSYAVPGFGQKPIDKMTTGDVLAVLSPIWTEKNETAKRLRQRLSTICD